MKAVLESSRPGAIRTGAMPQIQAEGLASLTQVTKRYSNGSVALDGLSISLHRGEVVALLGPNGAGKSTAVKLMMGLTSPTRGSVRVFGADPRHTSTRMRMGVMLQVGRAPETLRVREHVNIFRGYYSSPMPYAEIVSVAGLESFEDRLFGELSGGQKQRVLFALALVGDPDLVFLDEPTVGLDIEARRGLWRQIGSLAARGKTVLLTTHYLEEADALASRIVVINKGRLVCEGTPAEVKSFGARPVNGGTATVKIIRCVTSLPLSTLLTLPDVVSVDVDGRFALINSTRAEETLRALLAIDRALHSLNVQSPALEDAFVALTVNRN